MLCEREHWYERFRYEHQSVESLCCTYGTPCVATRERGGITEEWELLGENGNLTITLYRGKYSLCGMQQGIDYDGLCWEELMEMLDGIFGY